MIFMTRKQAKLAGLKHYYNGIHCVRGHLSNRSTVDGGCWKCNKMKKQRIRSENIELARQKDRDQARRYSSRNREIVNAIARKSYLSDKTAFMARIAARRASKLKATPKWADRETIYNFYLEAKYQQMHVDHIIPLVSKYVCGLHVEHNLQLLSAIDNRRKSNVYWEGQ